jgi:predicted ABC-type ATPase
VPIEKILSRYARSLANLSAVIRIADRAYIYDNSIDDMDARLFARTSDGRVRKVYGDLPGWIDDALQGVPAHEELTDLRVTKASD